VPPAVGPMLPRAGDATGYVVAFSGGMDSHLLLALMAEQRARLACPLRAVHVDHGLHPDSPRWAEHCARVCEELGVPLVTERVRVAAGPGPDSSPEARARAARYAAFERILGEGEALLTAHHLDDQAETFLLRLLRGAGTTGLAAMAPERRLGRGWLRRPLLGMSRAAIRGQALGRRLQWIEDPSNAELLADRNFLRHQIMPLLQSRWPGAAVSLAGAASDAAEANGLLGALAELDDGSHASWLALSDLQRLDEARQRNLLRAWLQRQGLTPPGRRKLEAGLAMLVHAQPDRQPEMVWPGGRVRRFRHRLHADPGHDPVPPPAMPWAGQRRLEFDVGCLSVHGSSHKAGQAPQQAGDALLNPALIHAPGLTLTFGPAGVRCHPLGRPGRSLQRLFQEAGIAPWLRPVWPVLMTGAAVAAVPSVCICEGFQSAPGDPGLSLRWRPWQRLGGS